MNIGIVIPVHNEHEAVGDVIDRIRRKGFDVVVINDGSTDRSGEIAEQHGAVVITNAMKMGKGASLRRGFAYILEQKYDGIVTVDGDGQHDADDLDAIVQMAETYPQSVIVGSRMSCVHDMPIIRLMTNKIMSWMISGLCGQNILDTQCGYRYIGTEILHSILLESTGYEIETEVLVKACRAGYPVYSVPVRTIYSCEKSKIHPLRDTWRFLKYFLKESWHGSRTSGKTVQYGK